MAVGAVFLLVGVLGFVPGITTSYDSLSFAGHMSDAKLLGIGIVGLAVLGRRAATRARVGTR